MCRLQQSFGKLETKEKPSNYKKRKAIYSVAYTLLCLVYKEQVVHLTQVSKSERVVGFALPITESENHFSKYKI